MMYYRNTDGSFSPIAPRINDGAPSDKTTYSGNKVEEIASNLADNTAIASTTTGINPTITDSADANVQGLTVYGKSRVSKNLCPPLSQGTGYGASTFNIAAGEYVLRAKAKNKNLAYYINDINGNPIISPQALNANSSASYIFTITESITIQVVFRYNPSESSFGLNDVYNVQIYTFSDDTESSTFEPYGIISIGDSGSLTITTANSDSSESSTATLTTGLPYCGIPVNSGETYTDGDGVKWLADSAGVEGIVKRCGVVDLGDLTWESQPTLQRFYTTLNNIKLYTNLDQPANIIIGSSIYDVVALNDYRDMVICQNESYIIIYDSHYTNTSDFKSSLTGVKLVYPIATPTTQELTLAELSALRGLKTYNPTTNVMVTDAPTVDIGYLLDTDNGQAVADVQNELQEQISYYVAGQGKINSILNHTYQGEALTDLFANEIQADYDNAWQWITARTAADNFNGINVADFIPITIKTYNLNAQIAGIKTYTGYGDTGDTAVGKHIDWISKELYPENHAVNKVNFNNGTAAQNYPWLASDMYHWLNSLSGTVPNETVVGGGTGEAVDYTADGVYYNLPAELKSAIIEKRFMLSKRYSASVLLVDDSGWGWVNLGKLWLPDECEVYGMPVYGSKGGQSLGGSAIQYPIFAGNMNRVKFRNGSHYDWWLRSSVSSGSSGWCLVNNNGLCLYGDASNSGITEPVCFRTGKTYTV